MLLKDASPLFELGFVLNAVGAFLIANGLRHLGTRIEKLEHIEQENQINPRKAKSDDLRDALKLVFLVAAISVASTIACFLLIAIGIQHPEYTISPPWFWTLTIALVLILPTFYWLVDFGSEAFAEQSQVYIDKWEQYVVLARLQSKNERTDELLRSVRQYLDTLKERRELDKDGGHAPRQSFWRVYGVNPLKWQTKFQARELLRME